MFTALALVVLLGPLGSLPSDVVVPADGLGLAATPAARSTAVLPNGGGRSPKPGPAAPLGIGGLLGLSGAALTARRVRRRAEDEPTYVLIHGDGGSPDDLDYLTALMGVPEHRIVRFDYRSSAPGATSTEASRHASTATASVHLDRLIRSVAARGGPVYSIHHSKGGAVGVEMIAALDAGVRRPIPEYRGAALLDPAIASGNLGRLQRLGGRITQIPDNGGFDPMRCDPSGCRDIRENLGVASGVEVIAVRNPDAVFTNFNDEPDGLRVFDLVDDGGSSAWSSWWRPRAFVGRVFEAHSSVLSHRAVAACVKDESLVAGSCRWTGRKRLPRLWWGRGRSHTIAV